MKYNQKGESLSAFKKDVSKGSPRYGFQKSVVGGRPADAQDRITEPLSGKKYSEWYVQKVPSNVSVVIPLSAIGNEKEIGKFLKKFSGK